MQPPQEGPYYPPSQPGFIAPPPQPPRRRRSRQFWLWLIGGSLIGFVALCSLCAYIGSLLPPAPVAAQPTVAPTSVPQAIATPSTAISTATPSPTATPVPTPKPTPTPTPPATIAENTPTLGGSVLGFDNKLGSNNCCNQNGWDANQMWVGISTMENGSSRIGFDEHSRNRVVGVYVHPYNATVGDPNTPTWPSLDAARRVCSAYFPSDAVLKGSQPYKHFDFVVGVFYTYSSALLAHTLPAKDFTDVNNHPAQPGLFYVYYSYENTSTTTKFDHCSMGTDQTLDRESETY